MPTPNVQIQVIAPVAFLDLTHAATFVGGISPELLRRSDCPRCTSWRKKHPARPIGPYDELGRQPTRMVEEPADKCCYCGVSHDSGIYLRDDPKTLRCQGVHA